MIYLTALWKAGVAFLALWAIARIMGKKLISQLTLFDFIAAVTLGSVGANAINPGQPTGPLLVGAAIFAGLSILGNWVDVSGRTLERFLDGEPTVLIQNGKVLEQNRTRNRLTVNQLESMLRQKGAFDLRTVEFAILETSGQLSVLPRSQFRPVSPVDLKLKTGYEGLTTQVMHKGRALPERLAGAGLTEDWLPGELARQGIPDPDQVFSAWLGSDGALNVDRYDDHI